MAENDDHEIPNSLQPLAAALTKAGTVEGVADALVREGLPALNACVAVLALLNDEGTEFFCPCITGYPEKVTDVWRHFPADAPVPIAVAVRSGRPILLKSLEERIAFYPPDRALPVRVGRALAAIPMMQDGVVGGLGFSFPLIDLLATTNKPP